MRIATWNLNAATSPHRKRFDNRSAHARAAWDELGSLNLDVALLQEAVPPPGDLGRPPTATLPAGTDREDWRSLPGPARWWCSAVAAWGTELQAISDEDRMEPLYVSQKGAYAAGIVARDGKPLAVASVYALWDYGWAPAGGKARYAHTSLHRAISDLTPILDTANNGMSVILAGDFNTSSQFESPHREAFQTVDDRLVGLGLENVALRPEDEDLDGCPCADEICRHLRTIEGPTPYQDDYIYVSSDLAASIRFRKMERSEKAEAISDHLPLVIDLDL